MYEIDFLPVGDGEKSGDAICMRFTRPDTYDQAVVVIDAGFKDDGQELVRLVPQYYGTTHVDLAILTHPDGDHIGGMGEMIRGLSVSELWIHDLEAHGGVNLSAAAAVNELIGLATGYGVRVTEPWAGEQRFGGALTLLGPTKDYYRQLVAEQVSVELSEAAFSSKASSGIARAVKSLGERLVTMLPVEIPFDAKDVSPRNNSAMINLLAVDDRNHLFTSDAGVPALDRAWDFAGANGLDATPIFVQVPHHGSRRNCSSAWLDRLLGPIGSSAEVRSAFVSCVARSDKHPSGRVVNAYARRGCSVIATAGSGKNFVHGVDQRPGWGPAEPLGPMAEEED